MKAVEYETPTATHHQTGGATLHTARRMLRVKE